MALLESATPGPAGQVLGSTVWGQQFLGWRFTLDTPSRITHVGGHVCAQTAGTGLFAAIVQLASPTSLPSFAPRSITDPGKTLTHLLFTPPSPSIHALFPLSTPLVVQPGTYGLVFGGADTAVTQNPYTPFGATGTGVMPANNFDLPGSTYFFGDPTRWNALGAFHSNLRFAVTIDAVTREDSTPPAPPSGLHIS